MEHTTDGRIASIVLVNDWRREFATDLQLLYQQLSEKCEDAALEAYRTDKTKVSFLAREGMGREEAQLFTDGETLISAEGMAGISLLKKKHTGKRILIGTPAPQLFNAQNALDRKRPTNIAHFYDGFTHVLPGSPFVRNLLKKTCHLRSVQVLDEVCTPLGYWMGQPQRAQSVKRDLEGLYPWLQGKRILAILGSGQPDKRVAFLERVSLQTMLDSLPEGWAIVTNVEAFLKRAASLPPSCQEKLAYVNRCQETYKTAAMADVLVTGHGIWACAFAASRKPVFALAYGNTGFEQYMHRHYPDLYLSKEADLEKHLYEQMDKKVYLSRHKDMLTYLSYDTHTDPTDCLMNVL